MKLSRGQGNSRSDFHFLGGWTSWFLTFSYWDWILSQEESLLSGHGPLMTQVRRRTEIGKAIIVTKDNIGKEMLPLGLMEEPKVAIFGEWNINPFFMIVEMFLYAPWASPYKVA